MSTWIPESASNLAASVDNITLFVTIVSVFFFVLISAVLVAFAIKYRRRSEDQETAYITSNELVEIIWTVIPSVLLMVIFAWGWIAFKELRNPPPEAVEVNVVAKQWIWQFEYFDGKKSLNELYVQLNKPVRLIMRSEDVLHSFFVPQFRVKQDILPGIYTQLWFTPTKVGTFDLLCAEYCGAGHSQMLASVKVLSPEAFTRWEKGDELGEDSVAVASAASPAERGKDLYSQRGCLACHSVDGKKMIGPSFKNLYGATETLEDGSSVEVDENYLRESIYEPQAKMVKGYAPSMPSFKGILSEDEVTALIEYIKTLR